MDGTVAQRTARELFSANRGVRVVDDKEPRAIRLLSYTSLLNPCVDQSMDFGWAVRAHNCQWYTAAFTLAKRRSVRHFDSKRDVSNSDIQALLEAAVVAPTAGNIQPWRFTVVRSAEARARLASAMGQRWAAAAPVVIVVCVDPRPSYARYSDRGENLYAIQDTAAAVENILLAAVDLGLASCWIGAFGEHAVAEAIGARSPIRPIAVLPVGYSAESAGRSARRPLEEITTWL